jgi:hypothetical protein
MVTAELLQAEQVLKSFLSALERLPDGRSLAAWLTFVPAAAPVINAFCDSAGLVKLPGANAKVDLPANLCLGRYVYVVVSNEGDNTHVSRSLTQAEALAQQSGTFKDSIAGAATHSTGGYS